MSTTTFVRLFFFFFFNDTATTEIYTLSLHDALPIGSCPGQKRFTTFSLTMTAVPVRSEEHTSELQSQFHLVCRLLLEKKKKLQHHYSPSKKQKNKKYYNI